ncbi:hypothetical protein PHET_09912 [Paragonimus heterotremus]|uniref:Uncharacterized protein n=1 Tax=Paragonimus heterotremus TaxID=100268 RepID=A0A8J4SSP9_9TREM|nr:hypothetical protein PHET_09912 [Paragonimus heterotremus]
MEQLGDAPGEAYVRKQEPSQLLLDLCNAILFLGKRSLHFEVPTLSSSSPSSSSASPSPAVQPASVSTLQTGNTPTFPKFPPVNLGTIATISATNTNDYVVDSDEDCSRTELLLGKDYRAEQLVCFVLITDHSHEHMRYTRLRAPTPGGLVAQMMQTVLHPVFAKQINYTGMN